MNPAEIPDDVITGPFGRAEAMEVREGPGWDETVCHWLLTLPSWHPAWSQYDLVTVRLRDGVPGLPPPKRQFQGATHEILCLTLNPKHVPGADLSRCWPEGAEPFPEYTPRSLVEVSLAKGLPHLTPVNVAEQIEGTDDEARQVAKLCASGLTQGALEPESSNGADRIRAGWKSSIVKALAHIRGEEHAP